MGDKVGIIGLGAIGHPLAVNLMEKGFEVHGYRRGPMDAFAAAGGKPAASPRELGAACDIVLTVLPSAADVRHVIAGPDGVLAAGREKVVIVELSTLLMTDKDALRETIEAAGCIMIDCPISGVPQMVVKREAILFASGDRAVYERHKAVFDGMSDKSFFLGEFGVGSKMKFVANLLVGVHILAAAEALSLGLKAGLDKDLMIKLLTPSAGASLQFQVRAPMMMERNYEPALAPHTLLAKDLPIIRQFAEDLGCPTPLLRIAEEYEAKAVEQGWSDKDVASIVEVVARECGVDLG